MCDHQKPLWITECRVAAAVRKLVMERGDAPPTTARPSAPVIVAPSASTNWNHRDVL